MLVVRGSWAFVHTPRTGGHSIEAVLKRERYVINLRRHMPARCAAAYHPATIFGFVRNPWDRLVSLYAYCYVATQPSPGFWDQELAHRWGYHAGFKPWLLEGRHPGFKTRHLALLDKRERATGILPMQRRPQAWWLDGCTFIGRFERLKEDFAKAMIAMGLGWRKMQRLNASRHDGDYRRWYDAETDAAVRAWHAVDIERWGYRFD